MFGSFRHPDNGITWLLLCQHFEQHCSIYFTTRDVATHTGSKNQLQNMLTDIYNTLSMNDN